MQSITNIRILSEKLAKGEPLVGAVVSLADVSVSEMMGMVGFDFVWIDMEHTALTKLHVLEHIIGASSGRVASFVRVPENNPELVKPILDMGPDGIIFPSIRNAKEAQMAVQACEYPPKGIRGCGPRRAVKYGTADVGAYFSAPPDFWKIIQIEHRDSVQNLDEIAQVPGIDCWMIGPSDLAFSLGKMGNSAAPEVQAAIDRIASKAREHGITLGGFTGDDPTALGQWRARGAKLFAIGGDVGYLVAASRKSLQTCRQALSQ